MISKELYKKDKAVICELAGRNRIFGDFFLLFSFVLCIVNTVWTISGHKESAAVQVTGILFFQIFWLPYYGFFIRNGGITVYSGAKSTAAAREAFKGSTLLLDTICSIPVRRESVFRYVMESWYMMTLGYLVSLASAIITALTVNASVSIHAAVFAAIYFLWTFLLFIRSFAVMIKSKKLRKLLVILLITVMIVFTLYALAAMFISMFMNDGISFEFIDSITNSVRLAPAAAVIILAAAVIYPAVIEFVFRKKILTKKEVGWYE